MVEKLEEAASAAATPSPDGNLSHSINKTDSVLLYCRSFHFFSFFFKGVKRERTKKKEEMPAIHVSYIYCIYNCFCIRMKRVKHSTVTLLCSNYANWVAFGSF